MKLLTLQEGRAVVRHGLRLIAWNAAVLCSVATAFAQGQGSQPVVAIHDSEYTRALENFNAFGATPTNSGTTGKQWWPNDWRYFVMPESIKESLRSDGTKYTVVGDSNIISGVLLTNGVPRYPIVISLAAEAIHDSEIAAFTNYVAAGGFLFIGSSSFTRTTNGVSRGDFAFANQMGLHMLVGGLTNWAQNSTISKQVDHRITSHIPSGTLNWRLPSSADEIPWGVSTTPASHPTSSAQAPHELWQVVNSNATVLVQGAASRPFLAVKQYGKGYFVYCAPMQPLLGYGGWAPSMYAYLIFRRSIEWAFESSTVPVAKVSPWPYPYDAAYIIRHDLESFTNSISMIESSAQFEFTNGARGDYYFCTGTIRQDASPTFNTNTIITSLRRAITNYGATIGPHNGGLTNANNALTPSSYDYWHWGPDEPLDITPPGYSSGSNYAFTSMSRSFQDIESWLSGLMTNGMRVWCAPYYNGTREASLNIQSALNVKIAGEQKLGPFPHWTLSTQTPNKRFSFSSQPVSDWFINADISHSMDYAHTITSVRALIDYYYNLGGLVNLYSHTLSTGFGQAAERATEYVTYAMNTNRFPRLWSANAIGVHNWWQQRSNVQINVSYYTNGTEFFTSMTISGSTSTNTAVELIPPVTPGFCNVQVWTNGVLAGTNVYRIVNSSMIRVRTGTAVTNVTVGYFAQGAGSSVYSENFDSVSAPTLPAGWTTSASGAQSAWVTQSSVADSAPNALFTGNAANVGESSVTSSTIVVAAGQGQLSFRNNYDLEGGTGGVGYDGGVLEIKIGTNPFQDIVSAGGTFLSGGYNTLLDASFSNPIGGRQAWSGNSGGFITTVVNLPYFATNQNVQFRWRCGTDNGGPAGAGWRVDSIVLTNRPCICCTLGTNAPVLPVQTNRTVTELSLLTVTNTASDADMPGETLFYSLLNAPSGAFIDGSGIITWTPAESQGPGTNTIITVVTDGSALSATNSFVVTILETNSAPTFAVQTNRSVNELTTLIVTNAASDTDLPANSLTYTLLAAPVGATISSNGVITWTPDESDGPGTNTFTTRVQDSGSPQLSTTNTINVTVNEVNLAPTLPAQTNRTIGETVTLTVTNAASDTDVPANVFTYQLLNAPSGASINSAGVITWTPSGSVGPSTNLIRTVVTDNGSPQLSATNAFDVIVNDTITCQFASIYQENFDGTNAPNLPFGWTTTLFGGQSNWVTQSTVTNTPPNAAFTPNPAVRGSNYLTSPVIALPSGQLVLAFRHNYSFETNYDGGVLDIKIGAGAFTEILAAGGSFASGGYNTTIQATDSYLSGQQAWSASSGGFVSTVVNLPSGASGQSVQFRWRCHTDTGNGSQTPAGWRVDTLSISNLVCAGNTAPVLPVQTNRTVAELSTMTVTNTAMDSDVPANVLTYVLVTPPTGATINTNTGVITWTPTEAQGPGTNTFTTIVTDDGSPSMSTTNSFQVVVTETNNNAPVFVLPNQTNYTVVELVTLSLTNSATDADVPANTLTYTLLASPGGATIDTNSGVITWTPTEVQGPGVSNVFQTRVTDNGVPALNVTNTLYVTVTETNNNAPVFVLPNQTNYTVVELVTLSLTNSATDADVPANTLTYTLLASPGGATINTNTGVITWLPTEAQGPSVSNVFTTVVTDNGTPIRSATNTLYVTVTETNNNTPVFVLPNQTNYTVVELVTLNLTNSATDADVPANTLTYTLLASPGGATINTNTGVITWLPTEAQGPSVSNVFTTVVTDNGTPIRSATNTLYVTVTESNVAPVLPVQNDLTVQELVLLTVTNAATDGDAPANLLGYSLENPPAGAVIDTNGVITWTPTEAQGPGVVTLKTIVSDGLSSATNSFTVTVTEVNAAPVLPVQNDLTVQELVMLTVTNAATDGDVPANVLNYSLENPPAGAVIDANGVITWTPTEAQGPGVATLKTIVSDGLSSATNSFTVTVTESNVAPVLPAQNDLTVQELVMLTVTNAATDGDVPANVLNYSLENPPAGAVIDANGVITWTPTEAQGPGVATLKTIVSDGLSNATNSFTVTVEEVNVAPVLGALPDLTIIELASLTVTNAANDQDVPANGLSYQLINAPVGASISAEGVISWTPSEDQAPSTNVLETVVNDGLASATNSFTVVVTEVNTAPVLPAQPDVTVNELATLVVTNVASDVDLPANVLIYSLVNPPAGAAIDAAGVITWTPDESQGPGTNVIITIVSDGSASATNSFVVTVLEVNLAPQLPAQSDRTIAELSTLVVTNTAMDADLPVNSMSYQLINPPAGALIDAAGVINWTPTEAQGPGTNAFVTVVSDGVLSTTNVFTVVVTEVNGAPVLANISDRVIHAGCQLSVHCFASDPDGAANVLSFSLAGTPPPGLTINPTNGALSWLTTEADAGTTNSVTVEVQDNGTPSLNDSVTFSVIVVERPRIENIIVENGVATVTWNSITNHSYRLQGTENLSAPVWQDIGEDVTATGSMAQQTNSVGGVDMRFYRVRLAP